MALQFLEFLWPRRSQSISQLLASFSAGLKWSQFSDPLDMVQAWQLTPPALSISARRCCWADPISASSASREFVVGLCMVEDPSEWTPWNGREPRGISHATECAVDAKIINDRVGIGVAIVCPDGSWKSSNGVCMGSFFLDSC